MRQVVSAPLAIRYSSTWCILSLGRADRQRPRRGDQRDESEEEERQLGGRLVHSVLPYILAAKLVQVEGLAIARVASGGGDHTQGFANSAC